MLEQAFTRAGIDFAEVGLLKGSDLLEFEHTRGVDLIQIIGPEITKLADYIELFYTYFPPGWNDTITVYSREKPETITPIRFLDIIAGAYPAICCAAHISNVQTDPTIHYFVDQSPSLKSSKAIDSFIQHSKTVLVPQGDRVNYIINAADILCRYIDEQAELQGVNLNQDLPRRIGLSSKNVRTHALYEKWLHFIKPIKRTDISPHHKVPHPVFYLFSKSEAFGDRSRAALEDSHLFRVALSKALETGGCVKFFEERDQKNIRAEDLLIVHNDQGKLMSKELLAMGCKATVLTYEELEKYKQ